MSSFKNITLRAVAPADVEIFFQQQLDPEAVRLAAFVNPRDRAAFGAHWEKILKSPENTNRTILADGQVAGSVSCYPYEGNPEVTYWIGREFWGRGIATEALKQMLQLITVRPVTARAAEGNHGSLKVLQKCGFKIIGKDHGFAHGRGQDTEEYLLRLD